ncbi:uncharacterized protein [Nicotiana tomentosiformis]|uniref:uncharacterized protein n=1 Tax=Nicotiana tomentosiformis TaxID=4098 RepID=UPI00388C9B7F
MVEELAAEHCQRYEDSYGHNLDSGWDEYPYYNWNGSEREISTIQENSDSTEMIKNKAGVECEAMEEEFKPPSTFPHLQPSVEESEKQMIDPVKECRNKLRMIMNEQFTAQDKDKKERKERVLQLRTDFRNLERQMGQLAANQNTKPTGSLPSDTEKNPQVNHPFEPLNRPSGPPPKPSIEEAPKLELKPLPPHLQYAYLGSSDTLPVIVSSHLLAGQEYYCFLDGYSGYNQIAIALEDQEKTTFMCPYGTYAFKRMPFGLCNAPATFQKCMIAIFTDMVERFVEVFMDDFSVFGCSFDNCLMNLDKVLARYHSSIRYLFEKKDAKPRLIRWCEGHHGGDRTTQKVLQLGLYWPKLFKVAHVFVKHCDRYQRTGTITRKHAMPLQNILAVELFDVWGIDFMGPFPYSNGHKYILVAVDYVSKWVKAIALPTNDAKVVVSFVKKHIFTRFGTPRVLISDGGTHFCNKLLNNVLAKYGVKHKVSTAYLPQTSGQVEVSNREVKQILEKTVSGNRKDWAGKLDDIWENRVDASHPPQHKNIDGPIAQGSEVCLSRPHRVQSISEKTVGMRRVQARTHRY